MEGMAAEDNQRPFLQPREAVAAWSADPNRAPNLAEVVQHGEITTLIGLAAQPGLFDAALLALLARNSPRPVVLALSNPTSRSEATPEEICRATEGRALVATGSPFPPQRGLDGRELVHAQCNNLYVFPGMGLGAVVAHANRVTHQMFHAASCAIANLVTPAERERGLLLPPLSRVREVSLAVALAVARRARDDGFGRYESDDRLEVLLRQAMWEPSYYPYRRKRAEVGG
jgi:malate dehydrogenase (oxaloacetate-decarboxylating)